MYNSAVVNDNDMADGVFLDVDKLISDAGNFMLEGAVIHGRCVSPRVLQMYGDSTIETLMKHFSLRRCGARLVPDCVGSVPMCACTDCTQGAAYVFQNKGDKMNSLPLCHDCFFKGVTENTSGNVFSSASEECQQLSTEILGRRLDADMILQNNLRGSGHIFSGFAVLPDTVKGVSSVSDVSLLIRRVGNHEVTRVPISRKKHLCEDGKLYLTAYYDINSGGDSFKDGRSTAAVREAAKRKSKKFSLKERYAYLFSTLPILGHTLIDKNGSSEKVAQSNFVNKGIHKAHVLIYHDAKGRLVQQQQFYIQIEFTMHSTDNKMHRVVFAASDDDKTQITTTTRRLIRRQNRPKAGKKRTADAIEIDRTASPPRGKKQCVTPPPLALSKSTVQADGHEMESLRNENKRLTVMLAQLHKQTSNFQCQNASLIAKMQAQTRLITELKRVMASKEDDSDPMDLL